ncbi:unnamed protein product [Caenorhabditis bovis]|uniref:Uncharacterized protein n=1 Tax=Caenorhabditis bovis TaxID=2654633 RepID=A0A8S1ERA4_9PELO|nr:unnamed protein product [Caenorhabditis bovis]
MKLLILVLLPAFIFSSSVSWWPDSWSDYFSSSETNEIGTREPPQKKIYALEERTDNYKNKNGTINKRLAELKRVIDGNCYFFRYYRVTWTGYQSEVNLPQELNGVPVCTQEVCGKLFRENVDCPRAFGSDFEIEVPF